MHDIPCNSAPLAEKALFLSQKGTFLPEDFHKVPKSQQNSEYLGLKFLS